MNRFAPRCFAGSFSQTCRSSNESGTFLPVCRAETVLRKIKVQRPRETATTLTWEAATAQAKGRSGCPLLDKRGLVIGVASGASDDHGYYVHIDEINRFLKENALERLYEENKK